MKSLIHKPLSLITKTQIRGLDAFSEAPTSVKFLRVKTSLLLHVGGWVIDDYGCVA